MFKYSIYFPLKTIKENITLSLNYASTHTSTLQVTFLQCSAIITCKLYYFTLKLTQFINFDRMLQLKLLRKKNYSKVFWDQRDITCIKPHVSVDAFVQSPDIELVCRLSLKADEDSLLRGLMEVLPIWTVTSSTDRLGVISIMGVVTSSDGVRSWLVSCFSSPPLWSGRSFIASKSWVRTVSARARNKVIIIIIYKHTIILIKGHYFIVQVVSLRS